MFALSGGRVTPFRLRIAFLNCILRPSVCNMRAFKKFEPIACTMVPLAPYMPPQEIEIGEPFSHPEKHLCLRGIFGGPNGKGNNMA